jgi:hypothetical protein
MAVAAFTPPPSPIDDLLATADQLAAEDLHSLPSSCLGDDLVALRCALDRLEAQFTRRLAVFDKTQGFAPSGAASAASWLRGNCRLSGAVAADRVRVARGLDVLPETARAFAAGDISHQHCSVVTRSIDEVGVELARDAEPIVLEAARQVDPGRLRMVTKRLQHCVNPDGFLSDAERMHKRCWLSLSQTLDGVYVLQGMLDPEGGATLRTALDALSGPPRKGDERSAIERRGAAVVELARRQLDGGQLPEVGGQKPHLVVTADLATVLGEAGCAPGELAWGGLISQKTVERLACDCTVTPVVLDDDGEPLSVGRSQRTFKAKLRKALVVRDKGCGWPGGCGAPPDWCRGHHLYPWRLGGPTRTRNGVLLCSAHHRYVHEGGWRLERQAEGKLIAIPP